MDEMIEEEFMLYLLNKNPNAFVNSHDYAQEPVKKRRFRHRMKVIDFWQTPWGRMLRHDGLKDEYSYQSRKFRRRFRLPHQVFERLTQDCKEKEIFKVSGSRIPVELKVLACLRILGRDACCDDIEEMSEIAESTVNAVFKQFVTGCVAKLFESYVTFLLMMNCRQLRKHTHGWDSLVVLVVWIVRMFLGLCAPYLSRISVLARKVIPRWRSRSWLTIQERSIMFPRYSGEQQVTRTSH